MTSTKDAAMVDGDFAGLRSGGNEHGVVRLARSDVSVLPPPQRVQTLIRRVR
jgi:hypothetical protein